MVTIEIVQKRMRKLNKEVGKPGAAEDNFENWKRQFEILHILLRLKANRTGLKICDELSSPLVPSIIYQSP